MTVKRVTRRVRGEARTWWQAEVCHYTPDGRTLRVRRVLHSKREAELAEREMIQEQAGQAGEGKEAPASRDPDPANVPTLKAFAAEFLDVYAKTNNKPSEVAAKESILRVRLIPMLGALPLHRITPRAIEGLKAKLRQSGLSPKTINNTLSVLRKLLTTAHEFELLERVPVVKWLKTPEPAFRFLDFGEAERLLDAMVDEPDWWTMILVALRTGLRLGELRALRWQDVDLSRQRVVVCRSAYRDRIGTPKNGRTREVPLSTATLHALKRHRHLRGESVFCSEGGSMLTKESCKWPLWRAARKAGLDLFGWHVLRHTFASHLAMRGVPMKAIQELLGHQDITMTMRYAHLSPQARSEAVEVLDTPCAELAFGKPMANGATKNENR